MTTISRRRRGGDEPDENAEDNDGGNSRTTRSRGSSRSRGRGSDDTSERGTRRSGGTPDRGRGRARGDDGDDSRRGRRASSSRESDGGDRGRGRGGSSSRTTSGSSGWAGYAAKRRTGGGDFADEFKPGDYVGDEVPIKVLDEGPYETYLQHWINEMPSGVRKSYVCMETFDEECPFCELGYPATSMALFNVLDLAKPKKPVVKVWRTSPAVADQLERLATSPRSSPLDRKDLYFIISATKKGKKVTTAIEPIDADKLEEYYEIEPFDADELKDFDADKYDSIEAVTQVNTAQELDDLIEEHNL